MSSFEKAHSRYLDPPDPPESDICDECHGEYDADDLREVDSGWWLCPECIENYLREEE